MATFEATSGPITEGSARTGRQSRDADLPKALSRRHSKYRVKAVRDISDEAMVDADDLQFFEVELEFIE